MKKNRVKNRKPPLIEEGVMTEYNCVIQNVKNFTLGNYTDIGAFTYMNAKYGIILEDYVEKLTYLFSRRI